MICVGYANASAYTNFSGNKKFSAKGRNCSVVSFNCPNRIRSRLVFLTANAAKFKEAYNLLEEALQILIQIGLGESYTAQNIKTGIEHLKTKL